LFFFPSLPLAEERVDERSNVRVSKLLKRYLTDTVDFPNLHQILDIFVQ